MDLWNLMLEFYKMYPKYTSLDLYIFGESYGRCTVVIINLVLYHIIAGHYVPAFSRAILESNSIYAKNFKGMGKQYGYRFKEKQVTNIIIRISVNMKKIECRFNT